MVKNNYPSRRQAKKQTNWFLVISSVLIAMLLIAAGLYSVFGVSRTVQQTNGLSVTKSSKQATDATQSKDTKGLPDVSPKDWELLLVNRDNKSKELNPEIADVDGVSVDARIAKNVKEFLAAAQEIDPSYHLISGYRSVAYQTELYNSYVQQEMAADPSLTETEKKILKAVRSEKPIDYLQSAKGPSGTVTNSEKQILTDLAQRGFMDEVINLMVAYSLGRTRSTNVNREYISKLANDFAFKNIVTAEQGLLALRSGYDKKSQQAKADSKKKTNVPSWSNPDYDNQTSQADQAKLDEIRRRALAKLEKGKE